MEGTMNDMKKAIAVLSALGFLLILLNLWGNPNAVPYVRIRTAESQLKVSELSEQHVKTQESQEDVDFKHKMDAKLWGKPNVALEPCWSNLRKRTGDTWGFVLVTISNGPHNHRAQIADAVVVAAHLRASLVIPNVKEALKEPMSRFGEIYNIKKFISSLDGVVRVVGRLPEKMEKINRTVTSIPLRVTRDQIDEKVRPTFELQGGLVYLGLFESALKGQKEDKNMTALRCSVMYKSLQFVSSIEKLGGRLVSRMREAAPESSGRRFVAVDLQENLLGHKTCNVTDLNNRRCLEPQEVGQFLKRIGFPSDTAIYLTRSRWKPSFKSLQELFSNVHTKEYSMPFNEESQYSFSGRTQFEQALDYYVCSRSDVFISTVPGLFYTHVTGERILAGLDHIIVPILTSTGNSTELQFMGEISPYVEKKNHYVYRCYCQPSLTAPVNKSEGVVAPTDTKKKPASVHEKKSPITGKEKVMAPS